ncbi:hypothetical protein ACX0MV_15765 [Pseudomonas borbori]
MGSYRLSTALFALGVLLGCASKPCEDPMSDACRDAQLLQQNDMLQAKLLIASGALENHELASALLDRAESQDKRGEATFYRAILKVREGPQVEEVLELLEDAANQRHPYAIAMLHKMYAEPYLVSEADPAKAEQYREQYAGLDVAKSGYPSMDKALSVVNELLATPAFTETAQPAQAQAGVD